MAKIKDFAKDLGLDLKDALELIERASVKTKANGTTIDDGDISTVLHVFTTERATKNMNKYLSGEATIPSPKSKKKAEPKVEPKVEVKAEPKVEKKAELKVEVKAEPKVEKKAELIDRKSVV